MKTDTRLECKAHQRVTDPTEHNSGSVSSASASASASGVKVVLVGGPNTGKSVMFNNLTGSYVTVSNYPGTTVDVSRGAGRLFGLGEGVEVVEVEVVDTLGMYSLSPITEEERVARSILLDEEPGVVLQLVDAKNLDRMLLMTLELVEAGLPLIVVLNLMDEAEEAGVEIDVGELEELLGVPVVSTVATSGQGMDDLITRIGELIVHDSGGGSEPVVRYREQLESFLEEVAGLLNGDYLLSKRAIGILLLQEDEDVLELVRRREGPRFRLIQDAISEARALYSHRLNYVFTLGRRQVARKIVGKVLTHKREEGFSRRERLSRAMMRPLTGVPILLSVLFLVYQFVGNFGAQILVDFLEIDAFEERVNPVIVSLFHRYIPWGVVNELFVGDYGVITLGVRYAVALILPIVGTFFIAFSIMEDTGYLPRMAMLIDRVFKKIGLNGRAVIPMILGFGCDTMATIVTRTLETRRERLITTMLLALAIPCSAQLGVILAILSGNPGGALVWGMVITGVFLLVGFLASRLMPGERPGFYMEIPPLRTPKFTNVLVKTYTRVEWYFKEVFPMFIMASVLIWLGRLTGVFELLVKAISVPVTLIGLPEEAAVAFLFGFFRRDYGAAGLHDLHKTGMLSGSSMVVAAVTLTLFLPCIAQFSVTIKERGLKTALAISLFIFPFAFVVGFTLNMLYGLGGLIL